MQVVFLGLESKYHSEVESLMSHAICTESRDIVTGIEDAQVLSVFVTTQVDVQLLNQLPKLVCILNRSTGYDHIDLVECKKRGIAVYTTPLYSTHAVAEYTVMLMLMTLRRVKEQLTTISALQGGELHGKTVGVIGLGSIGRRVAEIVMQGFGASVIAYDPYASDASIHMIDLDTLLKTSDVITLHAPLNESTRGMIGKAQLLMLKPTAIMINTSRGGLVDTNYLIQALISKQLTGAGLDVVEADTDQLKHLESLDTVILTPHSAYCTDEALERSLATTVANYQAFVSGDATNRVV
jgi:lactate dehydrogenase-like 2-hydroxyacid dehydrogenase